MKRLLLLATEFPPGPGGIGTHALQLATQLAVRGWEVAVISPQDYVTFRESEAFNHRLPFQVRRLRHWPSWPARLIQRFTVLLSWCLRWRPDALVASGQSAVWLATLTRRLIPVPCMVIGHGSELSQPIGWRRWLTSWAFNAADHIVCVSDFARQRLLTQVPQLSEIEVIQNGADHQALLPVERNEVEAFRQRLGLESAQIILTVGHVSARKGQDVVIRALPSVLSRVPNAHYVLAGLPTQQQALVELARHLGVEKHVHFLGRLAHAELCAAYTACDVFALTSRDMANGDCEGYGIVVVEAALFGKPVVVSRSGGLIEAVAEGQTGLVVPQGDIEATSEAVVWLLRDEQLRAAMGQRARARALANQTWHVRGEAYAQALEELVRKVPPASKRHHARTLPRSRV